MKFIAALLLAALSAALAATAALAYAERKFVAAMEFRSQALCDTDTDCAERLGGDGGPY
jgi:hypothetical protein